jgi:ABC-2 type transport system permease protein
MNAETAALGAAAPLGAAPGATRATLRTLIRRELWEHTALWLVPLIVAAALAVVTMFAKTIGVRVNDVNIQHFDGPARILVLNMSQLLWVAVLYVAAAIVGAFVALDCLYAERKDRSILFWKSLPVSDGLTVLSKFLVIVAVAPLGIFLLAAVSHLVALGIWQLRAASGAVPDVAAWNTLAWLRGECVILLCLILASLWYAPLVAASMLLSAWVKRSPLLWAILPLVLGCIFELIVFRTKYLWHFLQYRSGGIWDVLTHRDGYSVLNGPGKLLNDLNWAAAFTDVDLWLGVLAAAALLYAAVRIRRYRDDT